MRPYVFLAFAIILEVVATTALARSANFTKIGPSTISVLGYAASFWLLSFPISILPTGIVYAIWSGLGIVLITLVAWFWSHETLDAAAIAGLALILTGVIVINVFSNTIH